MRRVAAVLLWIGLVAAAAAAPYQGRMFDTEQKAQWECRGDEVIWVDPPTGRWFRKGNGWYADSEDGAYACRKEVEAAGRPAPIKKPAPPPPADYANE